MFNVFERSHALMNVNASIRSIYHIYNDLVSGLIYFMSGFDENEFFSIIKFCQSAPRKYSGDDDYKAVAVKYKRSGAAVCGDKRNVKNTKHDRHL